MPRSRPVDDHDCSAMPIMVGRGKLSILGPLAMVFLLALLPSSARSDPSSRSLYTRGHQALAADELASAIDLLEEAAEMLPSDIRILFDLATAYERFGNQERAIATYREVLGVSPSHEPARKALERLGSIGWSSEQILDRAALLVERGRVTEAAYLYKRYLADHPASERAQSGLERCAQQLLERREGAVPEPPTEVRSDVPENPDGVVPIKTEEVASTGKNLEQDPVDTLADLEPRELQAPVQASVATPQSVIPAIEPSIDSGKEGAQPVPGRTDTHGDKQSESSLSGPSTALTALGILVVTLAPILLIWRHRRNCTVRGVVEQFPLPDLLQWLGLSKKIGVLKITSAAAIGRIHLDEGKIIHAEWSGSEGEEALNRILALPRGRFVFRERVFPENLVRNLDVSIQQALMNWACQTDEASRDDRGDDPAQSHAHPLDSVDDESLNIHLPF